MQAFGAGQILKNFRFRPECDLQGFKQSLALLIEHR